MTNQASDVGSEITFSSGSDEGDSAALGKLSVVIPTLGHRERLGPTLSAILCELDARGARADEVVVVDDSGESRAEAVVAEILGADDEHVSTVRVVATASNLGFGAAVRRGVQSAKGSLLLVMQDDVLLRDGSLAPLLAAVATDGVFAATPVVTGRGGAPETSAFLALADDQFILRDPATPAAGTAAQAEREGVRDLTFLPATIFATRRETYLDVGGFDALFAPFAFEDVDLSITARRRGLRLVEVASATATHGHAPGSDEGVDEGVHSSLAAAPGLFDMVSPDVANAVIERNRLLLRWKHLQARTEARDHLVSLWRRVVEAGLSGDRETLQNVCLAFSKLPEVTQSRRSPALG